MNGRLEVPVSKMEEVGIQGAKGILTTARAKVSKS
jgi:hypothetical protein